MRIVWGGGREGVVGIRLGKWENWPKPHGEKQQLAESGEKQQRHKMRKFENRKEQGRERESGHEEEEQKAEAPTLRCVRVYLCDRDYKKKARSLSALTFGPSHQTACISLKIETKNNHNS